MDTEPPSLLLFTSVIQSEITSIIIIVFLLLLSALISCADASFFSLTPADFEEADDKKTEKKLRIVQRLRDTPEILSATLLTAGLLVNIAIVLIYFATNDFIFSNIIEEFWGIPIRFLLEILLITFLILLFAEILPRIYAGRNNVYFASLMARPVKMMSMILSPIAKPIGKTAVYFQRKYGRKKENLNVAHLSQALELSQEDTTVEEKKILQGIVTFGNTEVRQVMKNRMDIFALNRNLSYSQVLSEILENGFSRIPVYHENLDHIEGVLYVKDLIPHIDKTDFEWVSLLREAYFVPENKKLDDLLSDFKQMKMHLAIVVDEYGGTSGLISLEDIIEEIVGEISDEFDDEGLVFSKLDDSNYIFEGKTALKDFYKVIGLENPEIFEEHKGEAETIAGFILEIAKGFPKKNEIIYFDNYAFAVEAFEGKRIKQIKLTIETK